MTRLRTIAGTPWATCLCCTPGTRSVASPGTPIPPELRSGSLAGPEQAVGYRIGGWLDRSVVFANHRFTVVRDRIVLTAQADAQLGQNWTSGQMGLPGTHWVNVWTPQELNGWFRQTVGQNNLRWCTRQ